MADQTERTGTKRGLLAELGRRHVWRAAVLYIGAVWAIAQGIAQLGPTIGAPEWVTRWFLVACAIGFPFWIAFAWFFAWTPEGFKREEAVERNPALTRATGRKLDFWIIGMLAVAVVLLVTNTFVLHRDATSVASAASAKTIAAELAKVPEQSVAVLPFASVNPKQQYFSDGMAEELISDLTQVNGLKVIGKYSSFKFRNSKDSPAQIGATLGVANLIEGSVDQQGGRIRIVVGMIRAKDGASVWSHTYDQPLKDVFAIQSKIGQAVTAVLKIKLLGASPANALKPPGGNVKAYQLMLKARALGSTEPDMKQRVALLESAVKLAPDYAYAWAILSDVRVNLGLDYLSGKARQQAYVQARAALEHAMSLGPHAPQTLLSRGYLSSMLDFDQTGALTLYRRAAALAPNDNAVRTALAIQWSVMGQQQKSIDLLRATIATDPLQAATYANLAYAFSALGRLDQAVQALGKALVLQPHIPAAHAQLAVIDILRNDPAMALRHASAETAPPLKALALAEARQITGNSRTADYALRAYIKKYGKTQPYNVADLYAIRKQPDEMFKWLDQDWAQHDSTIMFSLLSDPLILRYKHDPRFAALCRKVGLPAPASRCPAPLHQHPRSGPAHGTAPASATMSQ